MRTKPSAVNAAARRLGIAPVAGHDRGRAQAHRADLAGRDRRGRPRRARASSTRGVRPPDADDRVLVGIVERGAEPDAGLGARVARRERGAEPRRVPPRPDPGVTGPPPTTMNWTLSRSKSSKSGSREHERELRRHAGDGRHPLALEQLERAAALPPRHDEAVTPPRRRLPGSLVMNPRCANDVPVKLAAAAAPGVADVGLGDERELAVAVERALRCAGRARREDDRHRPVGIVGEARPAPRRHAERRRGARRPTSRADLDGVDRVVLGRREPRRGEHEARLGPLEHGVALVARQAVVDARGDRADLRRREVGDEVLGAGRQDERDDVAGPRRRGARARPRPRRRRGRGRSYEIGQPSAVT